MHSFIGRTAVVTGAASGIGLALARKALGLGMKVIAADINDAQLLRAMETSPASDQPAVVVKCDVSCDKEVQRLCEIAKETFGCANYLFNNAGILVAKRMWDYSDADWQSILGVNSIGVANVIRHFVPLMSVQEGPAHIINTASIAGFIAPPGLGAYSATKAAVVSMSESLRDDLIATNSGIRVSVLCPAWVATNISGEADANPAEAGDDDAARRSSELTESVRLAVSKGKLTPAQIADATFAAIEAQEFYIFPHQRVKGLMENRVTAIFSAFG